jgi:hypothetical protein
MEKAAYFYEIDSENLKTSSQQGATTEVRRVVCEIAVR